MALSNLPVTATAARRKVVALGAERCEHPFTLIQTCTRKVIHEPVSETVRGWFVENNVGVRSMKFTDRTENMGTRVTVQDLRTSRYCLAGVRPWFRRHGLDWQDFLARGIAADRLRATHDALVEPVIRAAERREAGMATLATEIRDGR